MMVTRTKDETRAPQKEVMIESPQAGVSEEMMQKAQVFVDRVVSRLQNQTDDYVMRMSTRIEAGTPVISGYQYWNCLTIGPIQFIGNPPYLPNKIVRAGNPAFMIGIVWVNPAPGPGASLPGTTVLGGRPYRVRFESLNLSTVSDGPDATFSGTFSSPAPVITPFLWAMPTPDPGVNPALLEINLTADITLGGQPFAAFSTWHFDLDTEPGFLGLPTQGPETQFERPARILVYRD
jgi:hypothetical protein